MWKRSDLKQKAKVSFKRNYWKSVLISLLLVLVIGGGGGASGSSVAQSVMGSSDESVSLYDERGEYFDDEEVYDDYTREQAELAEIEELDSLLKTQEGIITFIVLFVIMMVVVVIAMAIAILIDVFICNPLEIGCKRFYVRNLNETAQIGNIGYAFDNNYKNIAKTMFFRDLYTVLWTLLFIIPGIVKAYEYQMIPYLLAENPQMTKEQAFAESKRMMKGQKWRSFVLDLSFIGWNILSALTLGILGIFYVQPYIDATHAALYEALRYGTQNNFYNAMPKNGGFSNTPNGMNNQFTNFVPNSIVEENPQQ